MIGVGVIGFGYWGPNLVRNFNDLGDRFVLRGIVDLEPARRATAQARYPAVKVSANPLDLLSDPSIDAIVIATPVSTHYALASAALAAGRHVVVEKPLTASSDEARRLVDEATRARRVLMVDHTFVFNPAVRKIRELVDEGRLGDLLYYDSVRVNLGLFQHDVNVLWDLAVHDVAIVNHLFKPRPIAVSAIGMGHVQGHTENLAYTTLIYDSPFLAHLHVNWLAPVKIRQTLIGGTRRMIVWNDLETADKVKVYDRGVAVDEHELRVGYRSGDMYAPHIDTTEALRGMAEHFADCIEQGQRPITDGLAGLDVVAVLEAATQSLRHQGRPVPL